jgi:hypothetical protein
MTAQRKVVDMRGASVVTGLVSGPFKSEQDFKQAVLKVWRDGNLEQATFEIENEEKEPGMPDVLTMPYSGTAFFTEFKYADKSGVIKFKKSQPLFYRQHPNTRIQILAWDGRAFGRVFCLNPLVIVAAASLRITLPEIVGKVVKCGSKEHCYVKKL